jgi:hypothetical protein
LEGRHELDDPEVESYLTTMGVRLKATNMRLEGELSESKAVWIRAWNPFGLIFILTFPKLMRIPKQN